MKKLETLKREIAALDTLKRQAEALLAEPNLDPTFTRAAAKWSKGYAEFMLNEYKGKADAK